MTPIISFEHVSFRYPEAPSQALSDVTLSLGEGEVVVVAGPSGAGKSTLLRTLNGLVPHFTGGTFSGHMTVAGLDPVRRGPQVMSRHVGFVFQDPEAQFVMDRVEDEIAFALENAAMDRQEMRARVSEALDLLGLSPLRARPLATLSGGEKQRVAIAAALALRPRILVLDEPTSQLDPRSAEDVLEALARLNVRSADAPQTAWAMAPQTAKLTVVLAEHRLERVLAFADRLVYVPGGTEAIISGPLSTVLKEIDLVPPVVALGKSLGWSPLPVTVEAGRQFSRDVAPPFKPVESKGAEVPGSAAAYLEAESLQAGYDGKQVLFDVSLALRPGVVTVLIGRNGSGKSTLLKSLIGLVRPTSGRVRLSGRDISGEPVADVCREVAYLPQDPNALLFADTVREELDSTLHNHGLAAADVAVSPDRLLASLGLEEKAAAYPRDLSVGERQRVALAAITVTHPGAILLDEPTRGLDYAAKSALADLIDGWRADQLAVLLVTHDVELAAIVADRVLLMAEGRIVTRGTPQEVLTHSALFAPQIAQLFPGTGWLTVEDALEDLGAGE